MAKIHPGATLTPHFRDFLPGWIARQPWYAGSGVPTLAMVGAFRLEDPAGSVGIETHLLSDGEAVYQVPMTYRDAPLAEAASSLIATASHSVLGQRWIYDGPADPVWAGQLLRLVRSEGVSESSGRRGASQTVARGRLLDRDAALAADAVAIDLIRMVTDREPQPDQDVVGLVTVTGLADGQDAGSAGGCLAVIRRTRDGSPGPP